MKKLLKKFSCTFLFFLHSALLTTVSSAPPGKNPRYFQLMVYHYSKEEQEPIIDNYLKKQLVPSLHAIGITHIGIFKAMANDTAADKKLYVFMPFSSLPQWERYTRQSTKTNTSNGSDDYINAAYDKPAFNRIENIFLKAFELMPKLKAPKLNSPKAERVYELRSYEGASEKLYRNKVRMFNQGGEMDIFTRLGFNAVFYGEVIFGCKMPNLMYMTSFDNMQARDEHWKAFRDDPAWKELSSLKEYQNNVSHIEISFLKATDYSDL